MVFIEYLQIIYGDDKMTTKNIMLVCSAGMSTSMLVTKMQQSADAKGVKADIFAVGASEADNALATKDISILLLGPQVRFMKDQFEAKVAGQNIPVEVIDMKDYGLMNGENVLETALQLINE